MDAGPRVPPAPLADVGYGDKGEDVVRLQLWLKVATGTRLDEDGWFGKDTRSALQQFAGNTAEATTPAVRQQLAAEVTAKASLMQQKCATVVIGVPPLAQLAANLAGVQVVHGEGDKVGYYAAGDRYGFSHGDGLEALGLQQGSVAHIDWVAGDVLTPSQNRVIGNISRNEGPFDAVNSYDAGYYTWGAYQLIGAYRAGPYDPGSDELSQGLAGSKELDPLAFAERFSAYGLDVGYALDASSALIKRSVAISLTRASGAVLTGSDVWKAVGTETLLNQIFINAGRDLRIQRVHVLSAKAIHFDALSKPLVTGGPLPSELFTSERLTAGFLDMELNLGRSKARSVFNQSIASVCASRNLSPGLPESWPEDDRTAIEQAIFAKALDLSPNDRYRARLQRIGDSVLLSADARSYR